MSVSVHGVQALFVKPAQSLAPMLGVAFLPKDSLKIELADMTLKQVRSLSLNFRRAACLGFGGAERGGCSGWRRRELAAAARTCASLLLDLLKRSCWVEVGIMRRSGVAV